MQEMQFLQWSINTRGELILRIFDKQDNCKNDQASELYNFRGSGNLRIAATATEHAAQM